MIDAIVYMSETGHTARYAKLLSERTGVPAYDRKSAEKTLPQGSGVFYMGWLMAGSVKDLDKVRGRYAIRGVAAVGAALDGNGKLWAEASPNGGVTADGTRVFYLRGGYEKEKLSPFHRFLMLPMEKHEIKRLGAKADRTPGEEDLLDLFLHGGSRVRPEALDEIAAWFAESAGERV